MTERTKMKITYNIIIAVVTLIAGLGTCHLFLDVIGSSELIAGAATGVVVTVLAISGREALEDALEELDHPLLTENDPPTHEPEQNTETHSTTTMSEQTVKEVAYRAWQGAANAFRLYPENKHTFAEYWPAAQPMFTMYMHDTRKLFLEFYEKVKHDDKEHQQWLSDETEEFLRSKGL